MKVVLKIAKKGNGYVARPAAVPNRGTDMDAIFRGEVCFHVFFRQVEAGYHKGLKTVPSQNYTIEMENRETAVVVADLFNRIAGREFVKYQWQKTGEWWIFGERMCEPYVYDGLGNREVLTKYFRETLLRAENDEHSFPLRDRIIAAKIRTCTLSAENPRNVLREHQAREAWHDLCAWLLLSRYCDARSAIWVELHALHTINVREAYNAVNLISLFSSYTGKPSDFLSAFDISHASDGSVRITPKIIERFEEMEQALLGENGRARMFVTMVETVKRDSKNEEACKFADRLLGWMSV